MGSFDDVIAMEPGDEWDDYDPTSEVTAVSSLPPVALDRRTNGVQVRLRGDVPAEVERAMDELTDDRPIVATVDLVLTSDPDGTLGGKVSDARGNALADWEEGEDPVAATRDAVRLAVRGAGSHVVRVTAAAYLSEGDRSVGVVVLHPDEAVRHGLIAELTASDGETAGSFVTGDELVLLPGSRTVFGVAYPVRSDADLLVAPSLAGVRVAADDGAPGLAIRRVVFVDTGDGPAGTEELSPAEGIVRWLSTDHDLLERYGPGVLDALVTATIGAEFRVVRADSVEDYVERIAAPSRPARSRVVLLHRFDPPPAGEGPSVVGGPQHSLRVARIDDEAVLVDGASGAVTALSDAEIRSVEAAATAPTRGRAAGPAASDDRLDRLRSLGVDVSLIRGRPSEAEAYALPNSALASSRTGRPQRPGHPPALDVLEQVVRSGEAAGVAPIVVGALVVAHDGTAPADAVEADRFDLLVEHSEMTGLVEALLAAEFVARTGRIDGDEGSGPVSITLAPTDERLRAVSVGLHTQLSVGPFSELVDHDEVRARAVPALIGGQWVRTLHPVDRFTLACVRYTQLGSDQRIAREVVLSAPRLEPVMSDALDVSDSWGVTRNVLGAVATIDATLPGLSPWLVERARRHEADRRGGRRRRR